MQDAHASIVPVAPPARRAGRERHRSFVGPVLLIGLGALFLGQNLGLLPPGIWLEIWRFWPVLLVLGGLELILGRSSWAGTVGLLVLTLMVVAFVAFVAIAPWSGRWVFGDRPIGVFVPAGVERVAEELGDARRATVDLRHGAGRLSVAALPAGSDMLIEADLAHGENINIDKNISRQGDQVSVRLRGRTDGNERNWVPAGDAFREDWTLALSPKLPMDLRVGTGASELNLDLSDLQVTNLRVEAGASSVKVVLPRAAGRTEARIQAGAAGIDVTIPQDVAARIRTRDGLSGTHVDQARFPRVGEYYQSPDYATAQNRVALEVETGVSGVTIR